MEISKPEKNNMENDSVMEASQSDIDKYDKENKDEAKK